MMEYGIKIISENPCDQDMNICKYYKTIHFIDTIDNLDELFNKIEEIKDKPYEIHDMYELSQLFIEDIREIFLKFKQN